jgi:hypothetical protein
MSHTPKLTCFYKMSLPPAGAWARSACASHQPVRLLQVLLLPLLLLLLPGPLTVRWKVGSTSCTTLSHKELAHSTELCCRNRMSLGASSSNHEALTSASCQVLQRLPLATG